MPHVDLRTLLEENRRHTDSLPPDYFTAVRDEQRPPVVSVCCSDSRVSQERMWNVDEPGWLFTPSNIGNVAWDVVGDGRVVDGNVLYPIAATETGTVAVVGHTGCGAVTAEYRRVTGEDDENAAALPPGIAQRVDLLEPVVEDAIAEGIVDVDGGRRDGSGADVADPITKLVEYNVRRQVAFLHDHPDVPRNVQVLGFVYDLHERYGDVAGRTYLVARDGATTAAAIRESLDPGYHDYVRSVLDDDHE